VSGSINIQVATQQPSMTVNIAPWYPKGRDYVFYCNATGYSVGWYNIDFGDGQKSGFTQSNSFFHRYLNPGPYTVSCSGTEGNTGAFTKTGMLQINVS
jgi:hypothetical protein